MEVTNHETGLYALYSTVLMYCIQALIFQNQYIVTLLAHLLFCSYDTDVSYASEKRILLFCVKWYTKHIKLSIKRARTCGRSVVLIIYYSWHLSEVF